MKAPPSFGLSHAWLTGLQEAGAASHGSVRELVQGAQGLDVLLEEGGAVQGLPITGVLEWTAVRERKDSLWSCCFECTLASHWCSCDLSVMIHLPTESHGSEETLLVGLAEFQGSLGGRGGSDEDPNMSTRSNMADYKQRKTSQDQTLSYLFPGLCKLMRNIQSTQSYWGQPENSQSQCDCKIHWQLY